MMVKNYLCLGFFKNTKMKLNGRKEKVKLHLRIWTFLFFRFV